MRRDVDEVRREARENGISEDEISAIRADDAGEYHRLRVNGGEERVTVLLHMRRVEGGIAFCKTVRNATVMREKVLPYRLYPVTHLCWSRVRGSCHGESPLTEAIPNQIAINKLYSMYVQCIKQVAFPKIVYDMTRFRTAGRRRRQGHRHARQPERRPSRRHSARPTSPRRYCSCSGR